MKERFQTSEGKGRIFNLEFFAQKISMEKNSKLIFNKKMALARRHKKPKSKK